MEQDEQHLRILSILHYVYAGLLALGGTAIALIYGGMGIFMLATPMPANPGRGQPPGPPAEVGWIFLFLGVGVGLFIMIVAVLTALAGRFLARHTRWLYCLIIAGLICLNMPIGTLLGVFTIIVLVRPTVKEMFEAIPARLVD